MPKQVRQKEFNETAGFADAAVAKVFNGYPAPMRARLLRLRQMILDTAAATDGVGPLTETLKWGQPAYLTQASRSGTTIRIDQVKGQSGSYALYVHCQTDLIESFRRHYPTELTYAGNRAVVFTAKSAIPESALRHCIALALTYHRGKKRL